MRKSILWNQFLPGMLLSVSLVSGAAADPTPLPSNRHIFVNVANDSGVKYSIDGPKYGGPTNSYYIKSDGGGLNSEFIAPLAADTAGSATVLTTPASTASGTLYLTDGGGRGFSDDIILLLSVKGPIPDDFSVQIKSAGYTWTPATPGVYNPSKPTTSSTGLLGTATSPLADGSLNGLPIQGTNLVYQPAAIDELFTKADFVYGPHTAKPGPGTLNVWSLPLYPGQLVSDTASAEYLMFIDLKAGAMRDINLIDNGTVKVDYTFTNLYGHASFNMYGWVAAANQGQGISFTNPSTTDGYTVSYTGAPVATARYSANGPYPAGTNVTITAEFSKDVADAPIPMITLSGAESLSAEMTKIDANHYSYSYTAGSNNGDVAVAFNANDVAGNPLALTTVGGTFTLATPPPAGNMTGGATVSLNDALLALQSVVGLHTPTAEELKRGDVGPLVNGKPAPDGKISINDVVLILEKLVGSVNW